MSQTICAITPDAGTYNGYTFVLAGAGNGFTAGVMQPNGTTSPVGYQTEFPSSLQASGSDNTCFCFLPNLGSDGTDTTTAATPPYWFAMGSDGPALWLGQIATSTAASGFSGSNVPAMTQVAGNSTFDAAPVGICYVPALASVYVAAANGNLYSFLASWASSGPLNCWPNLSYGGVNNSYDNAGSGAISIVADASNNLYVSGLTLNGQNATYVIPATAGSSALGNGNPIPAMSNTIATAISATGVYTATAGYVTWTSLADIANLPASPQQGGVWTAPSGVTIVTIAWSPNVAQSGGVYPDGALFIATSTNNVYAYDPSTGVTSFWQTLASAPAGMIADQNMNLMVQCANGAVYAVGIAAAQQGVPATAVLAAAGLSSNTLAIQVAEPILFTMAGNTP